MIPSLFLLAPGEDRKYFDYEKPATGQVKWAVSSVRIAVLAKTVECLGKAVHS